MDAARQLQNDLSLRFLASHETIIPLWEISRLTQKTIAIKLLSMSEGLIGELTAILVIASERAILTQKEKIDLQILEEIKWIAPSQRTQKIPNVGLQAF